MWSVFTSIYHYNFFYRITKVIGQQKTRILRISKNHIKKKQIIKSRFLVHAHLTNVQFYLFHLFKRGSVLSSESCTRSSHILGRPPT